MSCRLSLWSETPFLRLSVDCTTGILSLLCSSSFSSGAFSNRRHKISTGHTDLFLSHVLEKWMEYYYIHTCDHSESVRCKHDHLPSTFSFSFSNLQQKPFFAQVSDHLGNYKKCLVYPTFCGDNPNSALVRHYFRADTLQHFATNLSNHESSVYIGLVKLPRILCAAPYFSVLFISKKVYCHSSFHCFAWPVMVLSAVMGLSGRTFLFSFQALPTIGVLGAKINTFWFQNLVMFPVRF